jgi:hypothetical protein
LAGTSGLQAQWKNRHSRMELIFSEAKIWVAFYPTNEKSTLPLPASHRVSECSVRGSWIVVIASGL